MKDLKDLVVLDRESPRKCSIFPLKYRDDLIFISSEQILDEQISPDFFLGYLFLHVDGTPLTEQDRSSPLLLMDGSWKRAQALSKLPHVSNLPKRSLQGVSTSYPRVSKLYAMPPTGLATVEALYIARLIQGREDDALLLHYHWREDFIRKNQDIIRFWKNFWHRDLTHST